MTDVSSMGPQPGDERPVLTNRQGHQVYDNQNQRTVGARGPATLENYQFLEKISHFDRERIPERVVHARGATSYGFFEAYGKLGDEPIGRYTRAKLFQEPGKRTDVDGQMTYHVDGQGENPHVNYEPSITGGLREGEYPTHDEQGPVVSGRLTRKRIPKTNDYLQPGQRFRLMEQWERDDLVLNFVTILSQAERAVQERMVWHFLLIEDELGLRVGEGLGIGPEDVAHLEPLANQDLDEKDLERLSNLGKNGPRDVTGLKMTHCVPNERGQPDSGG